MKRLFTLLFLTIFLGSGAIAQKDSKVNYERDTKWFIGANIGGTWTTSTETDWRLRSGYGFTLGRSILGQRKGSPISFDLRARFLNAYVGGQSTSRFNLDSASTENLVADGYGEVMNTYRDSIGFYVPNYRTRLWEYDLELVMNTNALRERTGFNFYIWGGIGGTWYTTKTDLIEGDFFSQIYDYNTIGTSQSDLVSAQDGGYETKLVGSINNLNVDWMPSVGAGISYQINPWLSIGAEHKMTWTRTNMFDGMNYSSPGVLSDRNDVYHYTGVGLKINLLRGDTETEVEEDPIVQEDPVIDPIVDETPIQRPIVDIYDPSVSPYTTESPYFRLQANIYYVDGRSNVTFKQNGNINNNFNYNANTDKFYSNVVLQPGQNLFEITGVNEAGQDYESTIIVYLEEQVQRNPPIVTITNPPFTPYTTNSSVFGLAATVLEVDSKSQIRVYLNGVLVNNFSYNLGSKVLNANLNLMQGTNTVTVSAHNEVGSDSKTVQIIYEEPITIPPPVVSFVDPSVDPYYTAVQLKPIRATVLNVESKAYINVRVNGFTTSAFTFNTITKEVNLMVNLIEGANVIEITGTNSVGSDMDVTTIVYEKPETPKPPIVTFIDPAIDPTTVWTSTYNVEARVENVESASDIQLTINGIASTAFSFSPSSQLMNFTTGLMEGANVVQVKGTNKWGSDIEATTIIYKKIVAQAPPVVNITYPAMDNEVFTVPNITLTANVLNVTSASNISVIVNGTATSDFTFNTSTKVLTLPLFMNEGANTVNITGTNIAGTDSDARIVIYDIPEVPTPPTVNITNPVSSPYAVDEASYYFTATTTNIDTKGQISLMFNGVVVPSTNFSFTGSNQIIYDADLIEGNNVLNVTVSNADGSASDMAIVTYTKEDQPCIIPTIGYISPVPYSTVTEAAQTIDAQINNWSAGTTVELQLNGASVGYMTYNSSTSLASKAVTLNEGLNALNVIVTNDCGTNNSYFTLNYQPEEDPCNEPVATAISSTAYTTLDSTATIEAVVANVPDATNLTVVLNGTAVPATFDAGSGNLSATFDLVVGVNTIVVSAKTECGAATLTYVITREVCNPPVISGISPADGTITTESSVMINATVTESNSSEIVVLVNGVSQSFTYNESTNALSCPISLPVGNNDIVITATNSCGSDSKTVRINHEIPCDDIVTNLLSPASTSVTSTEPDYEIELNASGIEEVSQISCTFNGLSMPVIFDEVTGDITITGLKLVDGDNTVIVNMDNGCSTASLTYTINYDGCKTPVITLNGIYDGLLLSASSGVFSANLTNVNGPDEIALTMNGGPLDFTYDETAGVLQAYYVLTEGTNVFVITIDACETVSETINVTYEVPCTEISYSLVSPSSTDQSVLASDYSISLSAVGVEEASQINVQLNGTVVPFDYNPASGMITIAGITLIDGANSIVVTMTNECSSASVTYNIAYDGCQAPVITLGANATEVTAALYNFSAVITNIDNPSDIQFLVNGAPTPFAFDPSTGSFAAEMTLTEGTTTFVLNANGCETATNTSSVNYTIPCEALVYTLGTPSATTVAVAEPTYTVTLVVQNVESSGIAVSLNGAAQAFTHSADLLTVSGMTLADGVNNLLVSVSNECSSDTIVYTINHESCTTPAIDLSANEAASATSTYTLSGLLSNVPSADDVVVTLNGATVPFTYNPETMELSATLTLVEGSNAIELTANTCDEASASINVTYEAPCEAITYSLVSPESPDAVFADSIYTFVVNTANIESSENIQVLLNGTPVPFTFVDNVVTAENLALNYGSNEVYMSFNNDCSDEYVLLHVESIPCQAPTITLNTATTVSENPYAFAATVLDVSSQEDVVVKLNGAPVDFAWNASTNVASANMTLTEGVNTVVVEAGGCSESSATYSINYEVPCDEVSHTLMTPTALSASVDASLYLLKVKLDNVTEEQVTVLLNGAPVAFTFFAGTVSANLSLNEGVNTVSVTGNNGCSSETVDYSITYSPPFIPCDPITYNYILPNGKSASTATATYYLKIKFFNADADDIKNVKLNGAPLDYSFNPSSGMLERKGMSLISGTNIVTIEFANECSGETLTFTINNTSKTAGGSTTGGTTGGFTASKPVITNVAPATSTMTVSVPSYTFKAKVSNVTSKNDISLKVNGVRVTAFTYSGQTKYLTAVLKLREGTNKVDVSVVNGSQKTNKSYTINYKKNTAIRDGGTTSGGDLTPVITLISPSRTTATVQSPTYTFKARVTNVKSRSDIKITLNGATVSSFSYSSSTKQVTAVLKLRSGVNKVQVSAKNGITSASKSCIINYQQRTNGSRPTTGKTTTTGGSKTTGGSTTTKGSRTTTGGNKTTGGSTTTKGSRTTTGGTKTTSDGKKTSGSTTKRGSTKSTGTTTTTGTKRSGGTSRTGGGN